MRHMLIITSNPYIDRDSEIIKESALNAYVERQWQGADFIGTEPLLFWHDGDPIGVQKYADMIDVFLVEVYEELEDTEIDLAAPEEAPLMTTVKAVWDGIEANSDIAWGASHGFVFGETEDGTYKQIDKFETSTLPLAAAANLFTHSEVLNIGSN
jgi:hypothetical protein